MPPLIFSRNKAYSEHGGFFFRFFRHTAIYRKNIYFEKKFYTIFGFFRAFSYFSFRVLFPLKLKHLPKYICLEPLLKVEFFEKTCIFYNSSRDLWNFYFRFASRDIFKKTYKMYVSRGKFLGQYCSFKLLKKKIQILPHFVLDTITLYSHFDYSTTHLMQSMLLK